MTDNCKLSKIKIIVINLEDDIDRRNNIINTTLNKITEINNEIYNGVDGKKSLNIINTSNKDVDILVENGNNLYISNYRERNDYLKRGKLNKGQLGLNISFLHICDKLIFDNIYEYYLILEDDSQLNVDVNELYKYLNNIPNKFDMIHLDMSDFLPFNITDNINEYYCNVKKQYFNRTSAILLSKEGASKYISLVKSNICRPADDSFSYLFITDNYNVIIPNKWLFKLSELSKISSIDI